MKQVFGLDSSKIYINNHSQFVEKVITSPHNDIRQCCKLITMIFKGKYLLDMIIFSSYVNQCTMSLTGELFYKTLK